jgi:hypothetical protein
VTIQFDPTVGRVRLDPRAFEALVDLEASADRSAAADLSAAGVLVDGRPHQVLAPGLAAVTRPLARLEAVVSSHQGLLVHQGWMSVLSAVLADVGDGTYDFAGVATEFVPTTIARLVRLRPRPRLGPGTVTVTAELLDALIDSDDDRRARAADDLASVLAPRWDEPAELVRAGAWCFWTAEVSWAPPGRPVGSDADLVSRRVCVLDTAAGMLALESSADTSTSTSAGDRLTLVPTTPTDIWFLLSSILPSDADLGVPSPSV